MEMSLFLTWFYRMFGRGRNGLQKPSQQEVAIQKLRETEEGLKKQQESLEKSIEKQRLTIKENNTETKKQVAVQALKRKKRHEKELNDIEGKLSNVESQREALENANANIEVLKNMAFAAKAMKSVHENMDIDKVDNLIQDIREQQELAQEISDSISKPIGSGEVYDDDDELLAELELLKLEQLDKKLLECDGAESVSLPSVPSTLPSRREEKEKDQDEMEDLKQWSGIM